MLESVQAITTGSHRDRPGFALGSDSRAVPDPRREVKSLNLVDSVICSLDQPKQGSYNNSGEIWNMSNDFGDDVVSEMGGVKQVVMHEVTIYDYPN